MASCIRRAPWLLSVLLLAACGGGGSTTGSGGGGGGGGATGSPTNTLAVTVDAGPAALNAAGYAAANALYATIQVCTPGSTTACQTIDHVQVDTGSYGLEIVGEVLDGTAVPSPLKDPVSGNQFRECVRFADGYTWGSMVTVDVTIGSRTISNLPVHLLGDAAAGTAPASCSNGAGKLENSVVQFGANGVLGVGTFLQDCGTNCADSVIDQAYYICPASGCIATKVPVADQQTNPIGALAADNNGIVVSLPSVAAPGAASVSGTMYFGIGTQSNNAVGTAQLYTLDGLGTLVTTFGGQALTGSVIDSGSNAFFFNDSTIKTCSDFTGFFCPATTVSAAGTIQGVNGLTASVSFKVDSADTLFADANTATAGISAFPTLGGPNGSVGGSITGFDWGLPFFFGRSVYVLFENSTVGGTTGPAIGF